MALDPLLNCTHGVNISDDRFKVSGFRVYGLECAVCVCAAIIVVAPCCRVFPPSLDPSSKP